MRHTLLALVLLFLSACIVDANSDAATGADQGPVFLIDMGQPDAQTDLPPETSADLTEMGPAVEAARPLFSLEAATSDDDTFYDFPIPSDLRLDPQGRPDIEHMPGANNVALIKNLREYVRTGLPGFAPHITSYVRFSAPIDSSDLGRSIDPTNPDAPIWLVDVDPDSPAFGTKLPIDVKVFTESTLYWRPNTLSARPIPGARLRPGGTYALLVRDRLTSASGAPVAPAPAFQALVEDTSGEDPISRHYADLFERLRQLDIDPADLLVASMYTTSDPRPQMDALASAAQGVTLEPLGPWQPVGLEDDSTLWRGSFTTTDFMSGPPPFDDPGEGRIEFDDQGDPVPQRTASVRISVRVPNGPVPPNGFPLLVYSHGTGGDAYSGTGASFSVGKQLASSGIATVGFDGALHGIRTTKEFDYASRALSNLMSVREMIRQSVVDEIILLRLIQQGMFRIPAATAERPDDITFRTDPWIMGHSQGGEQNGILVGLDIPFEGAYFSAAPAGLYILLVDQIYEGTNLGCALGVLASVDCPQCPLRTPRREPALSADPLGQRPAQLRLARPA